jgi:hypothetical protein
MCCPVFRCVCGGGILLTETQCVALPRWSRQTGVSGSGWASENVGTPDEVMGLTSPAVARQRNSALARANHVRGARAALKRQIASGQRAAADVIVVCPDEAASMPISELLRSQRGWGEVRCSLFLSRLSLREDKPVGSLTERQRSSVVSLLTRSPSS